MEAVTARYSREFFVRIAVTGGIFLVIGLLTLSISRGRPALIAVGVVPTLFYVSIMALTHLRAVRQIDREGVTRLDGKRLAWSEFKRQQNVHTRMPWGQPGPLNNIDLYFTGGRARVFPYVLENAGEMMAAVEHFAKRPVSRADCGICTQLRDEEWAMQKAGHEDEDTNLPAAAWQLESVRELKPGATRSPVLKRCPECGTFYVYRESYEFLVYGSEDEQRLIRFDSEAEAVSSVTQ